MRQDGMVARPQSMTWMVRLLLAGLLVASQAAWLSAHSQALLVDQFAASDAPDEGSVDEATVAELTASPDDDSRRDVAGYAKQFSALIRYSASILSPSVPGARRRGRGVGLPFVF